MKALIGLWANSTWVIAAVVLLLSGLQTASGVRSAWAAATPDTKELAVQGKDALSAGKYALAIEKLEQALTLAPEETEVRRNLAHACNQYGLTLESKPNDAIRYFHRALYLSPGTTSIETSVERMIRKLGKNPHDADVRESLGEHAVLSHDYSGAVIEYSEAAKMQDSAQIRRKLGAAFRLQGEIDKAIEQFQRALTFGQYTRLYLMLGQAYQEKNDLPNALAAYSQAIQMKPTDDDTLWALVKGWKEALKQDPTLPRMPAYLDQWVQDELERRVHVVITKQIDAGIELRTSKLFDESIAAFMNVLKQDPGNASVMIQIAWTCQAKGDYSSAIEWYHKAQDIEPANISAKRGIRECEDLQRNK